MTVHVVVAVYDSAVLAYNRPFVAPTSGVAVRSFSDEVNRAAPDNLMFGHPDDYALWQLAAFDDESGVFSDNTPSVLVRGKDVKRNG